MYVNKKPQKKPHTHINGSNYYLVFGKQRVFMAARAHQSTVAQQSWTTYQSYRHLLKWTSAMVKELGLG